MKEHVSILVCGPAREPHLRREAPWLFTIIDELGLPVHLSIWSGRLDELEGLAEVKRPTLVRPTKGRDMREDRDWEKFGRICAKHPDRFLPFYENGLVGENGKIYLEGKEERVRQFLSILKKTGK